MSSLSKEQAAYLRGADWLPPDLRALASRLTVGQSDDDSSQEDRETVEQLRTMLTARLAEMGFDKDYEPTGEGMVLEQLIDALCAPDH